MFTQFAKIEKLEHEKQGSSNKLIWGVVIQTAIVEQYKYYKFLYTIYEYILYEISYAC